MNSKSARTPRGPLDGQDLLQSSSLNKSKSYLMKTALRGGILTLGLTIALASVDHRRSPREAVLQGRRLLQAATADIS
jgi:hypothetical protein